MKLDFDQLKELIAIVDESQLGEFKLESEDFKLSLKRGCEAAPQEVVSPLSPSLYAESPVVASSKAAVEEPVAPLLGEGQEIIAAPMVGTFYRAPSPEAAPFVEEGAQIEIGSTVCIIEAMKLMNEIEAELRGRVVKILAENGQAVEYGQPLFVVEPV